MPRDGRPARLRLQQAALDLYTERGFDQVTTAEIAARAGVTERTFYRHFADKREVLFGQEDFLRDALERAVAEAPGTLGPLATVLWAFRRITPLLEDNRPLSEPLHQLTTATPALRERELAKTASLACTMTAALGRRGVDDRCASLAAQTALAVAGQATHLWIEQTARPLDHFLAQAIDDLNSLCETDDLPKDTHTSA
ncbi:TetR family transcriptional regulator [Streptomyces sp. NPDC088194]|uniref:TetR family transcriptional regulator n=1 Tax=Streptomyces sp. NPDC088194 TaxID=3154931 RepID=UPI00344C9111